MRQAEVNVFKVILPGALDYEFLHEHLNILTYKVLTTGRS